MLELRFIGKYFSIINFIINFAPRNKKVATESFKRNGKKTTL